MKKEAKIKIIRSQPPKNFRTDDEHAAALEQVGYFNDRNVRSLRGSAYEYYEQSKEL